MRYIFGIIVFLWAGVFTTVAFCADMPPLTGRVVDEAGILTEKEKRLIESFLEQDEKNQIVLSILDSLRGMEIEEYANLLFNHWKLGDKDENNGVLIIIAPHERQARIEVGYGLEHILTDAIASHIIQEDVIPYAKEGDYGGAALSAAKSVVSILTGQDMGPGESIVSHPYRTGGIFDEAGILSETQKKVIQDMIDAEQRVPIIVAVVSSLRGKGSDYFSELSDELNLDKRNMVLIVIAPNEKKIGLSIGGRTSNKYISDERIAEINSTILIPYATQRDYAGGIEQAILAIQENLDHPKSANGFGREFLSIIKKTIGMKVFLTFLILPVVVMMGLILKYREKGWLIVEIVPFFLVYSFLGMCAVLSLSQVGFLFPRTVGVFIVSKLPLIACGFVVLFIESLCVPIIWTILVLILKMFGIKTLFGQKLTLRKKSSSSGFSVGGDFGGGFSGGGFSGGGGRSGGGGSSGRW